MANMYYDLMVAADVANTNCCVTVAAPAGEVQVGDIVFADGFYLKVIRKAEYATKETVELVKFIAPVHEIQQAFRNVYAKEVADG